MTKNEKLVAAFKRELDESRREIQQDRENMRKTTGRSISKSRTDWLKNTAMKQVRERQTA